MRELRLVVYELLIAAVGGMLMAKPVPSVSSWHAALAGMGVWLLYRACYVGAR